MKKLDSWKQIAAYVGKDIRTAQLWEKNEGLPIHRLTHTARANVFAYDAELDAWVRSRHEPPLARRRRWPWAVAGAVVASAGLLVVVALRERPRAYAPASEAVVAVLPFTDQSGVGDHLADGLTDDIIVALGRAGRVPVISRTSTASLTQVSAALHANAVVEGTLQRSGSRVRISADLVDTRSGRHLWSQQYERDLSEVLSAPEEVAGVIAGSVLARLTGKSAPARAPARPVDPDARLAYLTGRFFWAKRNEAGLTRAVGYFKQAIAKDPDYAPAYSGLADGYTLLSVWGSLSSREAFPLAEAAARKALALDSNSAEAYTSLAIVTARWDWDFVRADEYFRRAIAANPNYATAHQWYGEFLGDLRRADTSVAESRRAVQLDPLSAIAGGDLAVTYIHAGQPRQAVAELTRVLAFAPDFVPAHQYLSNAYAVLGDTANAEAQMREFAHLTGDTTQLAVMHVMYTLAVGRKSEAVREAEILLENAKESQFGPYQAAQIYFTVGEKDKGYAALDRAYQDHTWFMVSLMIDTGFAPVRHEPRFLAIVRRVGIPTA
jgi:TolB-like protein/Flp pilus assembly protein TadD